MKKIMMLLIVAAVALTPVCAQALTVGAWGTWATVGTQLGAGFSGYLGYSYFGGAGGASGTHWLLGKVDYNLAKLGDVQTKAGVFYWGTSPDVGTQLGLTWGVAAKLASNLSVGCDIVLAQQNTKPSTTDILPSAVVNANLTLF